jgi:hypothetical protein
MNARKEFLEEVADKNVKCAKLYRRVSDDEEDDVYYNLSCGFTIEDYEKFLSSLDFGYDSGFGEQELFGTIWYYDGTWSDRREYDGSEWWSYQKVPNVPEDLL